MKRSFAFGAMLVALATIVTLFLIPDAALAAGPLPSAPGAGLGAFLAQASLGLAGLRAQLTDLETRAAAKLAEVKDDTADDVATRIEGEHAAILREIETTRGLIGEAERAEAARNQPGDDAQRAIARTAAEEAVRAERTRSAELRSIAQRAGMDAAAAETAINGNVTVETFRAQAFEHMAAQDARTRTGGRLEIGRDQQQTRHNAAIDYLMHRARPGEVRLTDASREFRGMSLIDLARNFLESHGHSCRSLTPDEIARRAFHSTSDFPSILENVANKSLRRMYEAYPQTFRSWTTQENARDFKAKYLVQLGEAPQLEKVGQSGEFKRGTITEGKQALKVETYGKIFGITRQVLVNDDLGAFTRIPGIFGTAIATLESDIVYALVTGNVNMADNVALFHASHGNLAAGVALSIDGISKTRTLMSKQKGLDGKTRIKVRPRTLLVPPDLETVAEQILNQLIVPSQTSNAVPASIKSLQLESEPRLADNSTTAYYLAGDPSAIDTIAYSYLEGQEGAYVESKMGWDVDGMEVKCRLDFGATVVDHRGLSKNPGA